MGKIIDGQHLFQNNQNPVNVLRDRIEFYRNFLLLYEGIDTYNDYFLTFHTGLNCTDEFVSIYCPHCGYILNDTTMCNHKIWVHGKQNADNNLDDRSNWGIVELLCPECTKKTVIVLE